MILFNILENPILFIGFIVGILLAISIHEASHAWVAYKLGDPTAKLEGRVSLNPFVHLDLFGTVMLMLVGFGWGKPVPVNVNNLHSKWDEVKVALAGCVSNFLLALFFSLILRFVPMPENLQAILLIVVQINLTLMIFNLLPIPPLDGSSLLKAILPEESFETLQRMSTLLFLVFIIFLYASPIIPNFIGTVVNGLSNFLLR